MQEQNHFSELPNNHPKYQKLRKIISSATQVIVLTGIMILVAGHESINPYAGKSHIDFYFGKSQELIKIQSASLFLECAIDSVDDIAQQVNQLVADLYKVREYKPIWTKNYSTTKPFSSLIDFLDSASYYGFPEDYFNLSLLRKYEQNIKLISSENEDITKRIELEIQASRSAILLLIYLNQGIISNNRDSSYYNFIKEIPELLYTSIQKGEFKNTLVNIQPKIAAYRNLRESTPSFISLVTHIEQENRQNINDSILSRALYYTGISNEFEFDSINTKETLLEKFQREYKLTITGTYDSLTHHKLSSVLNYRYYQVCLNFDRLRKLNNTSADYLMVNIPEFKLHVIENQKLKEQYNVIVGKTKTPTPSLSSNVEKIVANPYWTVPRSIANNEMLWKIRKDSTYLARNGYFVINNREEIVEAESVDWTESDPLTNKLWIRQKNSHRNALGQVKFLFPNKYNVYLHDTPSKRLFSKEKRAYSHGCIRVQNPDKLARYLAEKLIPQENDSIDMHNIIKSSKRTVLELENTMAIHIQYITCLGDETGILRFFNDIYKKDSKDINSLFPVDIAM